MALCTTGMFTHGKTAARNHPGSNFPRVLRTNTLKVFFSQNLPKREVCESEELVQSKGSSWCPSKHRNQNPVVPEQLLPRAVTVQSIAMSPARWGWVYF